jgi:hypothetical protein
MVLEIADRLRAKDLSKYPNLDLYKTPLERALWILWVVKDELGVPCLNADEISSIARDVFEVDISQTSIVNACNRAGGGKVHINREGTEIQKLSFIIMKEGKDFLKSKSMEGKIKLFYFQPDKDYSSRCILQDDILTQMKGDLRIVDPFCGERTLSLLVNIKNNIKFLTKVDKLNRKDREKFLSALVDFKNEKTNIEFKNLVTLDIHDRYIISLDFLVILGHGLKDLGKKGSFGIMLEKKLFPDIVQELIDNFDKQWNGAANL